MSISVRPRLLLPELFLLACGACSGEADRPGATDEQQSAYSGLLITLDTTRADALSCYGKYAGVTPHLDRLAQQGVLYESAHTVAPLTLPAHASMLTGLYPLRHGVRINGAQALPPEAQSLAETARDAGLQTAACIAALVLDDAFGLAQGFETFGKPAEVEAAQTTYYAERPATEVIDEAIEWLRKRDPSRRFFLWVHLFDPHFPASEPDPLELDLPPRLKEYLGEVARMDREIGRLLLELDHLGLDGQTVVLAVGDHGEGLEEHQEPTHSLFCYQTTLRVPMILRYPDRRRAGERSSELVSVVDVAPTLAGAMGLGRRPGLDGIDLSAGPVPADRGVYFESYYGYFSYGWSQLAGWLDSRGKYVHSSSPEFFDLRTDPGEQHDLAAERASETGRYKNALEQLAALPTLVAAQTEIDPDLAEGIRSLGYVSMGDAGQELPGPLAESGRPSPVEMIDDYRAISNANALMNQGRAREALPILIEIVTATPDNLYATRLLSSALLQVKRFRRAIPLLKRLIRSQPGDAGTYRNLSYAQRMTGREPQAIESLWRAIELDPSRERYFEELIWILREREQEAEQYRRRYHLLRGDQ